MLTYWRMPILLPPVPPDLPPVPRPSPSRCPILGPCVTFGNVTQVLVTNQIAVKFDDGAAPPLAAAAAEAVQPTTSIRTGTGGAAVAALGNTWSHSVNSRLLLEYVAGSTVRRLRIAKSPLVGSASLYYEIRDEGPVATTAAAASVTAGLDPYEDDVAVGLYTGATTRNPHGAAIAAAAVRPADSLGILDDDDAWLDDAALQAAVA